MTPTFGHGKIFHVEMPAPEITARFRDPGGNVIGLYEPWQERVEG